MAFSQDEHLSSLTGIGRGIEREGLRVLQEGRLSLKPHYKSLGSALTHPYITTDYSETLLEFITPVSFDAETTIAQLQDIQKYTLSQIDGELLWPMSMPCFVDNEDAILLANYGSSNVGLMKTAYRQGLKNRYGSMMQVISGIHFNFSFSQNFWQSMQQISASNAPTNDFISEKYFSLLRNYKRYCWLIPYLYGSSPAICGSFLKNKATSLPFKKSTSGYMYLEYSTSLRMSDLGYTNSEQSSLQICYNDLDGYLDGVQNAINLPSEKFAALGVKVDGKYQQLNSNILQIENELYAPIRPKQVAKTGEKPSEALRNRGVEYIEVRALDVNPFSDTGISIEQVYFLDVFITYCALADSPLFSCEQQQNCDANMDEVVVRGRDPQLLLNDNGCDKSVKDWGIEIFSEMGKVAKLLDNAHGGDKYTQALLNEYEKLTDPSLTPSAKLLDCVVNQDKSLTKIALQQAQEYRQKSLDSDYQIYSEAYFAAAAVKSIEEQKAIEDSDQLDFDTFLSDYFAS